MDKAKKKKLLISLDEKEANFIQHLSIEEKRDVSRMVAESLRAVFGHKKVYGQPYPEPACA